MSMTRLPNLGRATVSHLAGEQLRTRIVRGVWKPGERLPSERQLSEQLGVSRASVREAIRGLEAIGLVDVRHGQGVFVCAETTGDGPSFANWHVQHGYSIGELLAFRLLVEPELAALAAQHADDRFVDDLADLTSGMALAAERGDLVTLVQMDTAFHDAITRRAGNQLYRDLLDHVAQLLVDSRRISLAVPGRAAQVAIAHQAVVDAIRRRDSDAAWLAMRNHLTRFAGDMQVRPVGWDHAITERGTASCEP